MVEALKVEWDFRMWLGHRRWSGTLGCGWGVEGGVGLKDVAEWDFRMWLGR